VAVAYTTHMSRLDPVQREKARNMRRTMTHHERELWHHLRGNKLGVHFRRQHPIGVFIVDFAAVAAKLVVEIDGATHEDLDRESVRDAELQNRGWRVVHFTNRELNENPEWVLAEIARIVSASIPSTKIDRSKSTGTRSHPTPGPSQREG